MDPEIKEKANNFESEESSKDSSPLNNSNVRKEGVKKVITISEDDCTMDVDKDDENSTDRKSSETENGETKQSNDSANNKENIQDSNEKAAGNRKQNNVDEKGMSSETLNNAESDTTMESEKVGSKKDEEKDQSTDKNATNKHSEVQKADNSDSQTLDSEKTMDVEDLPDKTSSKSEDSTEKDCSKDNVRPDKDSNVSLEVIESEDGAAKSPKVVSNNKEAKDKDKSEVANDAAITKDSKGKDSSETTSTETKSEHSKKDGETKKKKKTCEECGVKKRLKFQVLFKGKTRFLCSDTCFTNFKMKQNQSKPSTETPAPPTPEVSVEKCAQCQKEFSSDKKYFPVVGEVKALCSEDCIKKYHADNFPAKNCSQCKKVIENTQNPDILTWETMVFCNEDCLGKYQSFLGSHCTCCQSPVPQASLGKYSVCFGSDIRQFCSCSCLDDFKKNLKVCSFCQTDLSAGVDSFLAPVGDKGQFKDFCSQNCMERYETMNNISKNAPQTQVCSHCKKQGTFKIQVKHENETYALCGDVCVAGFRCAHNIKDKMCYTCFNFFSMSSDKGKEFSFKFDGQFKQFCTKACMTLFVLSHRKIIACVSCKVKKYNFDMIEKIDGNNQTQIFCSLNCLSLYRVTVNAASSKSVRCDNCSKTLPAQYHLTMSDGSVRNFCTYNCVMLFQNQYTNVCTLTTTSATRQTSSSVSTSTSKTSAATNSPVISNVVSLAPAGPRTSGPTLIRNIVPPKLVTARPPLQPLAIIGSKIYTLQPATRGVTPNTSQNVATSNADQQALSAHVASNDSKPSATITTASTLTTVTNASGQQVLREVIVKPPAPKSQKNKSVACKPIMQHKGINVKPQPCHKAVQTDDSPRPILVPVPVPYYVPVPLHMFSRPVPCPVPFPVPMFVPIVIPPKESSSQERMALVSGENSREKRLEENSLNDGSQNSSHKENEKGNRDTHSSRGDEAGSSGTSDEYNDVNDIEDDEYAFKDKSHRHGKRHAHHKNKAHKKSRTEDVVNDEAKSHNAVSTDENRNSSVQNDHLEPVPRLKVP